MPTNDVQEHEPDTNDTGADDPIDPAPDVEDATDAETTVMGVTPSGAIEVTDSAGDLVPLGDTDLATVADLIVNTKQMAIADSEEVAVRLALKKLNASSVDELNAMGELGTVADILNIPVLVSELHWNESRVPGSEGAYPVFDATNTYTGEKSTIGCGHQDVVITLYKAAQWGLLPCMMIFTQAKNLNRFGKPTYLARIEGPPPAAEG